MQDFKDKQTKTCRIGFCGTVSVGKSTLVHALQNEPEFKDFKFQTERSKYLNSLGIPLNTDSTLKGQTMFVAERTSELFNDNIITDRSIIDVMAFTEASISMNRKEKDAIINLGALLIPQYDYIFYIPHDGIKLEDNGLRCTNPDYRDLIDWKIRNMLRKYKNSIKNFNIISGSTEERIHQIKQIIFS